MKTKLFSILAAGVFALSACSTDDPTVGPIQKGEKELIGKISKDMVLDANVEYTMTGTVIVEKGATLKIPAGTTIKAKDGGTSVYLLVEQGAKIDAQGTADKPIVFTSSAAAPKEGDWGGIIINGYAPISSDEKTLTWGTEINTSVLYGGDKPSDNSGILNFVKIAYTGARIDGSKEHNGLTLNAVGNGTKISNIYLTYGADDAIEFFGGTVNVDNILVVNCSDDMFDFTQGYTGKITNAYGIREKGYSDATDDPRGIEADGNMDGKNPSFKLQSHFTIDGLTIINNAAAVGSRSMMTEVVKIRRKAKGTITNAYFKFGEGTSLPNSLIDLSGSKPEDTGDAATTIAYTVDAANGLDKAPVKLNGAEGIKAQAGLKGANTAAFSWTAYKF
ncbi:hypothetical protein [Sphingobacterium humi]|uniref:T9SS C-terminal target domain-containing protein n=1 Tax=Sphingobacterium humi TaxID=1796905 RepID=A0A6N8L0I1_9SPHI|nr:hypothetical protein [Sphingobacterium humi]MVZ62856.1 hypothetical protein [Sphingobacterium humi]